MTEDAGPQRDAVGTGDAVRRGDAEVALDSASKWQTPEFEGKCRSKRVVETQEVADPVGMASQDKNWKA
jgi:hypothetical protein